MTINAIESKNAIDSSLKESDNMIRVSHTISLDFWDRVSYLFKKPIINIDMNVYYKGTVKQAEFEIRKINLI